MIRHAAACAMIAACLLPAAPVHANTRLLHPDGGARMWLPVGGKSRLYFRLESGKTTVLKVKGPGEIKFIVRAVADGTSTAPIAYSVAVSENGQPLKTVHAETLPGATPWKDTKEVAARSRSFKLRVPDGTHSLQVAFQSASAGAAGIRYVFSEGAAPGAQVALQATTMRESVTVLVKERALDYYVADAQVPVQVDVIGPSRLRVTSRLIFPGAARGEQRYTMKVQRDGHELPDVTFATTKSAAAECESHPEWILARGEVFYVDIPKGAHVVLLRLSNADAPGVALRFSIPKEDAVNVR